jgi:hypothetical protein
MADYRIYLLDDDGRIVSAYNRMYGSDDEACDAAGRGLGMGGQAEVWQGIRCLGRVTSVVPRDNPAAVHLAAPG